MVRRNVIGVAASGGCETCGEACLPLSNSVLNWKQVNQIKYTDNAPFSKELMCFDWLLKQVTS